MNVQIPLSFTILLVRSSAPRPTTGGFDRIDGDNMLDRMDDHLSCPLQYSISVFSGKWKPYIIWYLASQHHAVRYLELKRIIPYDISDKVFTQQLKELVNDGILVRKQHMSGSNNNVKQVAYALTKSGYSLCNLLYALRDWGVAFGNFDICSRMPQSKGLHHGNKIIYCSEDANQSSGSTDFIIWMRSGNLAASDNK